MILRYKKESPTTLPNWIVPEILLSGTSPGAIIKYTTNLGNYEQDLLKDLVLTVNKPLKTFDAQKIVLTDTNYARIADTISLDTTQKIIHIKTKWTEDTHYRLVISKDAMSDSAGN